MAQDIEAEPNVSHDLGDGLVMRKATFADRERVAELHANYLFDGDEIPPVERLYAFVLDLMSKEHPTFKPGDFTLVEDTNTGKVVSSMCLISQRWSYAGIPFAFGQPDIVSTELAYRRRGLVRAQMNEIHRWSAERGELVQGITGILWYYRQFGYEYALSLDANRTIFRSYIPKLKDDEQEAYCFREATIDDIPLIREMYEQAMSRSLVASVRDETLWRYDLVGRHEKSGIRARYCIIETPEKSPVGVVVHSRKLWGTGIGVRMYEVKNGVPFLDATPGVLRHLDAVGEEYATRDSGDFQSISFNLGETHPVYDTVSEKLFEVQKPYAWYLRVPDLFRFVSHVAPALEKRLAESPQAGYTGEMKVSFFTSGLHLKFNRGSIAVENWKPEQAEDGDATFPGLIFLQMLFGYRSLEELQYASPDCTASTDDVRSLLPILFPKEASRVWVGG